MTTCPEAAIEVIVNLAPLHILLESIAMNDWGRIDCAYASAS